MNKRRKVTLTHKLAKVDMDARRKEFLGEMLVATDADLQARGLGGLGGLDDMATGLVLRIITTAMGLMSDRDIENSLEKLRQRSSQRHIH